MPITLPVGETVATLTGAADHVPGIPEVVSSMVSPTQSVPGPLIIPGTGKGLIVTTFVAVIGPHTLLTV